MAVNANKYDRFQMFLLKSIVFLLPLFVLPGPIETGEFAKLFILVSASSMMFLSWAVKRLKWGNIKLLQTPVNVFVLIFAASYVIASFFSINKFNSYFGAFQNPASSLAGVLAYSILFFTIINLDKKFFKKNFPSILKLNLYSFSLSVILSFFVQPFSRGEFAGSFIKNLANTTNSSYNFFLLFLILNVVLLFYFLVVKGLFNKLEKYFFSSILFISVVLVVGSGSIVSWFLTGFLLVLTIGFLKNTEPSVKINSKLAVLIALAVFLGSLVSASITSDASQRKFLNIGDVQNFAKASISQKPIFGYGPGNFQQVYSKFRTPDINTRPYWKARFAGSRYYLIDVFIFAGLMGGVSLLVLSFSTAYVLTGLTKKIFYSGNSTEDKILYLASVVSFSLLLFQLFYDYNIVSLFYFWFWMSSAIALWAARNEDCENKIFIFKTIRFGRKDYRYYVFFVISIFVLIYFTANTVAFSKQVYSRVLAEKGSKDDLIAASRLSPKRAEFKILLSKFYIKQAKEELTEENADYGKVARLVDLSVKNAKEAQKLMPNSVVPVETLGVIYREMSNYSSNASAWSIEAFRAASFLEPSNPVIFNEIGKMYYKVGDTKKAEENFNKSLSLKPDFAEPELGLAKTKNADNKYDEAINILKKYLEVKFNSQEGYFELGRAYYNINNFKKAEAKFKTAINIDPDYSNALYSLGLSLEAQNRIDEAVVYYKKTLEKNPTNVDLIKKISDLEK